MALACNAMGNIIPPHFIFPRKKFLPHFVLGGPEGCLGTANGSGWMQEEDFLAFLGHFVNHTRASVVKKVLLLLDNHSSHISTAAINYCRENGVVMLSFPPHCTHHLQPLDKAVYGPLKKLLAGKMDQWHRHHPGKTVTIYDMPSMLNTILLEAASPRNILKGFSSTGIWPLNKDIFPANVFLPASVTDRPSPVIPGPSNADLALAGPSNDDPPVMCSADLSLSLPGPPNDDLALALAGPSNDDSPVMCSADLSLSLPGPPNYDLALAGPSNDDPPVMCSADLSLSLPGPPNYDLALPGPSNADLSLTLAGPSNADLSLALPGPAANVPSDLLDGSLTLVFPEWMTILVEEPEEVVVTTEENEFSPETVRPYPRAGPRKESSERRKRSTEILTDTPVKEAMEEETASPKKVKRNLLKGKKNGGGGGKQKTYEDAQCLVCTEWFSDSRPGESWMACSVCRLWAHTACTPGGDSYTCHHCE